MLACHPVVLFDVYVLKDKIIIVSNIDMINPAKDKYLSALFYIFYQGIRKYIHTYIAEKQVELVVVAVDQAVIGQIHNMIHKTIVELDNSWRCMV